VYLKIDEVLGRFFDAWGAVRPAALSRLHRT
jgi:hypothetical protein